MNRERIRVPLLLLLLQVSTLLPSERDYLLTDCIEQCCIRERDDCWTVNKRFYYYNYQ